MAAPTANVERADITRPAPPGWSASPVWKHAVGAASSIAVADNRVAVITEDHSVTLLNADTGESQFTSEPQTALSGQARPILTSCSGVPVVAVLDGALLMLWPVKGAQPVPTIITLPPGASLAMQGGGLLVATESATWRVTDKMKLQPVALPGGQKPLAVLPDGTVLSASTSGPLRLAPAKGAARTATSPPTPDTATGPVHVAWAMRGMVGVWWAPKKGSGRVIGVADAVTGKLYASGTATTADVASGLPLQVSEDGRMAAFGPLVIDTRTGKHRLVPGLTATLADSRQVYGTRDGERMAATPAGAQSLPALTAIPWGTSTKGLAIVLDRTSVTHVAALSPTGK